MAGCQSGYVAACKAAYAGSIPASAFLYEFTPSPGGGIGRRKGLKIPRLVTIVPVRLRPRAPFYIALLYEEHILSCLKKVKITLFHINIVFLSFF